MTRGLVTRGLPEPGSVGASEFEEAILADPEDGGLWFGLAIHILNRGYYRERDGSMSGPLPRSQRVRVAFPVIARAVSVDGRSAVRVQRAVNVLIKADATKEASLIASGADLGGAADSGVLGILDAKIAERTE